MVHGLETLEKMNAVEHPAKQAFALVSTVDSMGESFPSHCVLVFDNEREAVLYAVKCIVEHDNDVECIEDEAVWTYGDEHYDSPDDLLDAWQHQLGINEYFHVKPARLMN